MTKEEFLQKAEPYLKTISSELFDEFFGKESKKRESWYATDIGKCQRGVYLDRLGGTEKRKLPEYVKNVAFEGKMKELEAILRLVLDGTEIIAVQPRLYNKTLDVSGRPDAIIRLAINPIIPKPRIVVEEIKTINSRAFWYRMDKINNVFEPFEHHVLQLTYYLHELLDEYPDIIGRIRYRSRDDGTEQIITVPYRKENWHKGIEDGL